MKTLLAKYRIWRHLFPFFCLDPEYKTTPLFKTYFEEKKTPYIRVNMVFKSAGHICITYLYSTHILYIYIDGQLLKIK